VRINLRDDELLTFALRKMCHEIKESEMGKACGMRGGRRYMHLTIVVGKR